MTKSLEALKPEMARESGSILIIAAARLVRMEALRPLHVLSELGQKTIGTRAMRDAIDRVEESLLREGGKIRDGHDMLARKLREAESRIAELEALCVKPADAMREVAPLCVKLPTVITDRQYWTTWEWITHLGGRYQNGEPGDYIEFGSVFAVEKLLNQYGKMAVAITLSQVKVAINAAGGTVEGGE